ncbi:serine hydrolase [Ralstonia pseudosolanacearum]|uniref:serine hydrolase n=2 Tax=Ralstonia pseudosolanacearum TaxID=1310165 RepID=UPI00386856AC
MLSMTSGRAWNEWRATSLLDNDEFGLFWRGSQVRYTFDRPMAAPAGTRFDYSGDNTAVLAQILAERVGMPLPEFARHALFEPLGITDWEWVADYRGRPLAFAGLRAPARPRPYRADGAAAWAMAWPADRARRVDCGIDPPAHRYRPGPAVRLPMVAGQGGGGRRTAGLDRRHRQRRAAPVDRAGARHGGGRDRRGLQPARHLAAGRGAVQAGDGDGAAGGLRCAVL